MKEILVLIFILLVQLPEIVSSESWFGYVKTTEDNWTIYRHNNNMSFKLDQHIEGKIEAFEGPRGRVLSPYSSYFEDMNLNDVRLKTRTAALKGSYSSEDLIDVKAEVKSPVGLYIDKFADSDIYKIDFIEEWPAEISARRTLEYSGIGINSRDFIGNNLDFAGTNLLYNKELSKDLFAGMSLERMNATVIATDERIIRAEKKATRDLNFRISADTTGIADLKYQQAGPEFNRAAVRGDEILNSGDERYHGSFNMTKNILMRSRFEDSRSDESWLPCCYQGWMDMNPMDKRTHSAEGIFDCTCSSMPGVET